MRYGIPLAITSLIVGGGVLSAQEVVPVPPPDPAPPSLSGQTPSLTLPSLSPSPTTQLTPTPPSGPAGPAAPYPSSPPPGTYGGPPTGPYGSLPPGPYGPYGPPPGPYGPYGPPPGPYGPYGPPPPLYRRAPLFSQGDPAGNPNFWLDVEALIWWSKSQPLSVPVVTTGPASQGANAGGIGVPGTASLNQPLNYGAAGGARLTLGGWCDVSHTWGIEGDLFSLGQQSTGFSVYDHSGNGSMVINEPVIGAPYSTQVSAPGVETGGVAVSSTSQFWGGGINGLYNLMRRDGWTVNLMGGFRYLQLNEQINIVANSGLFTTTTYTDNMGNTLATAPPGSTVAVIDHFGTRNDFYGGQVGVKFQYMSDRWSVNGMTTLALGGTHESVSVNGVTNVYPVNAAPVYLLGGNYATLQSGRYWEDRFAAVPGFQLTLGYQFTPFIRGTIGYNFLLISNVVRPGNQIDNTYDGVVHPLVPMTNTSYWTQGINLGLQVSF